MHMRRPPAPNVRPRTTVRAVARKVGASVGTVSRDQLVGFMDVMAPRLAETGFV